jgi:quercetin dioxygenase-like cupin family protein
VPSLVPALADSALALATFSLAGDELEVHDEELDSLLYVLDGSGALALDGGSAELTAGTAALVLAGEAATVSGELEALHATVGPAVDVHAALGEREASARVDRGRAEAAVGMRGFEVLFGPHNGSARATLFLGYLPPGRAAWHYHLYDEIVFVPKGPGRLHRQGSETKLEGGSAFRLRPREVHIVENVSADDEMTIVGFFTPAGSPSAAYLAAVGEAVSDTDC